MSRWKALTSLKAHSIEQNIKASAESKQAAHACSALARYLEVFDSGYNQAGDGKGFSPEECNLRGGVRQRRCRSGVVGCSVNMDR